MGLTQSELTLQNLVEEREIVRAQHEAKLAEIAARNDKTATHDDKTLLRDLRERAEDKDTEITDLTAHIERDKASADESKKIRRMLAGGTVIEADSDGVVYRDFTSYAYDEIISRSTPGCQAVARQWGCSENDIMAARERLQMVKRTPANTLSSNVGGLIPPQHISEIFQKIDKSRGLVQNARRVDLDRGTITYPQVDTSPVVAVQSSEKTEAGNTGMAVSMVTKTASTYLGGGDLSWQAINWSTPSALDLWFDLVAADYALKTETDAATIVSASAFLNNVSSPIGASPTYAQLMTGIALGGGEVYTNSGRMANAVIMAPDRYWYSVGLTSDSSLKFGENGLLNVNAESAGLRVIVSRGLNAGEIIVGDMAGLLVAETAGAPIEMRVVEPAIGGVEVGLIGAFEAAVVDDGAFSLVTTAS